MPEANAADSISQRETPATAWLAIDQLQMQNFSTAGAEGSAGKQCLAAQSDWMQKPQTRSLDGEKQAKRGWQLRSHK